MTLPTTVASDALVTVTATAPLRHRCPYRPEIDRGSLTVTWETDEQTIELHDFARYLNLWGDSEVSHEEITDRIRRDLDALPGLRILDVSTAWETAGMEVRCSTSPTPADLP